MYPVSYVDMHTAVPKHPETIFLNRIGAFSTRGYPRVPGTAAPPKGPNPGSTGPCGRAGPSQTLVLAPPLSRACWLSLGPNFSPPAVTPTHVHHDGIRIPIHVDDHR